MTELLSYSSLKNTHQMREYEEKKMHERKRNLLYLIAHYLKDEGYYDSVATFANEAQLTSAYKICDNIDLLLIFQDFESYYYIRFQKYPKICKKSNNEDSLLSVNKRVVKNLPKKPGSETTTVLKSSVKSQNAIKIPGTTKKLPDTNCLSVIQLGGRSEAEHIEENCERTLKPIQGMGIHNPEWIQMAEMITRDIVLQDLKVKWSDIMGLDEAKRLLKEAVIYPIKYPELFTGILTPWKGLLLFGPPGTGKTLLAKAVATECKTTFFNITSSSIVSKWRGDSEKLVRVMFDLARYYAPSTIFLDELDALVSKRDGINQTGEHEGSRRLKTELLIQLDGLSQGDDQVFFLATSNLPWDLDPSMLRRLEKKILVGLPNTAARQAMFKHYLPETVLKQPLLKCDICYETLGEKTEGYSGSDIQVVCKETAMQSLRQIFQVLENTGNNHPCVQLPPPKLELKTITTADVQTALAKTKPSASHLNQRYKLWQEQFGSV